jgi:hypothetical protein
MRTEALFSTCAHFLLNLHFFSGSSSWVSL